MAGDIDHIVGARHDVEVAVLVNHPRISGFIVAGEGFQIGLFIALFGLPEGRECARGQRQFDGYCTQFPRGQLMAVIAKDLHVVARHGHGGRAEFGRQFLDPQRVGGDGIAGLGLPPVVHHRHAELFLRPDNRVGVGALAGEEQGFQAGKVVFFHKLSGRILAFDGAKGGRGGEEGLYLVFGNHPPEGACVRCADRFALEQDRGRAVDQRAVGDIGMAHHPADIGGGPEDLSRIDVVDVFHGPVQRHHMPAGGAHDAFGLACGAGGIKDVERIGPADRHAFGRCGRGLQVLPVEIAALDQIGLCLLSLQDNGEFRFVLCQLDRAVQQGFIGDHPARLDPAGGGDDGLRRSIVDTHGQFVSGKTAEDYGMHRADAGAGEHGDDCFGDHGHIDDDAVALLDAFGAECAGKTGGLIQHLGIGELALRACDRAVVDHRDLIAATCLHMAVKGVVTGVRLPVRIPLVHRRVGIIERLCRLFRPVDGLGGLHPEGFGIGFPAFVNLFVTHFGLPCLNGVDTPPRNFLVIHRLAPAFRPAQQC